MANIPSIRSLKTPVNTPRRPFRFGFDRTRETCRFYSLVARFSNRMTRAGADTLDAEILRSLKDIFRPLGVDRGGLLEVREDLPCVRLCHAWYGENIDPFPQEVNFAEWFPWQYQQVVGEGKIAAVRNRDALPIDALADRRSHDLLGIRSSLTIPLYIGPGVPYLLAVQSLRVEWPWSDEIVNDLRLLGEIFAGALERRRAEEQLQEQLREIDRLREKLEQEKAYVRKEVSLGVEDRNCLGTSQVMQTVMSQIKQVAGTSSTVLIQGETGTGKELVARMIHRFSERRNRAMVMVNCAALPAALVESELFGREKGAFTGALSRQMGRFELANGSTLFLDEIAEMPIEIQVKLLRVLQEGEFERLGSSRTIKVDVRIIAASNRDLAEAVEQGTFRRDLYYRLNIFPILVPPLRDRREDIPAMVWEFVNEFGQRMGKKIRKISNKDMELLKNSSWPGNCRELRNLVEHAMILSNGDTLELQSLAEKPASSVTLVGLEEVERRHIQSILDSTNGRIKGKGGAAEILGLNPSTLYSRMRKLGISTHH
ncbi:MAG: sigma 54-interacting transcriptional regulator [Syntrophotaleaceae bacterium]